MAELPFFAMQVSDLPTTIAFYTEKLGFTLSEFKEPEDVAYVIDSDGDLLLMAGPATQDLLSYLATEHFVLKPGESLSFAGGDLEARRADLLAKGVTDLQIIQRRVGDRILRIQAPDGYSLDFIQPTDLPFAELLAIYQQSPDELDEVLVGLDDAQMGLAAYEGGWNIRQIVHHIVDTDILYSELMKLALSAPGTVAERPRGVGNERVSQNPEYRERPVASSLKLVHAFHEYFADNANYIVHAEESSVEDKNGQKQPFRQMIYVATRHAEEHINEISEIRRKHAL